MDRSYIFHNVYITLSDDELYQAMFYHKGFIFLIMDEENDLVSFIPVEDKEIKAILADPTHIISTDVPDEVIWELDYMLKGHENDFVYNGEYFRVGTIH
jgi:hypothetical protein